MSAIWRFPIDLQGVAENEGYFYLDLPMGTELLYLAVQERAPHAPCIWARVDQERPPIRRKFLLIGTGQEHPALAESKWQQYVGTFQKEGFVFHVWEVPT